MNAVVHGAEAIRSVVNSIRALYDDQDFNFAGPYSKNGFLEDYTGNAFGVSPNGSGTPGRGRLHTRSYLRRRWEPSNFPAYFRRSPGGPALTCHAGIDGLDAGSLVAGGIYRQHHPAVGVNGTWQRRRNGMGDPPVNTIADQPSCRNDHR